MSLDAWITALVIVGVLIALVRQAFATWAIILSGTLVLLIVGVLTPAQAFSGFSNPAPITVAALYVLAAGIEKTGALASVLNRTMGQKGRYRRPLARVLTPTLGASAFLNNTPIVAMLIPQITAWAERRGVSASKLLMPVSFAALIGGMITVIGTSTNLVVSGAMVDLGLEQIGFFEIGKLGLPIALVGLVLLVLLSPKLLPSRRSAVDELQEEGKRFAIEMIVDPDGPVDGRTIDAADLRSLPGLFLVSVDRGDTVIAPARPDTVLRGGNRLRFVGSRDRVVGAHRLPGLSSTEHKHVLDLNSPSAKYFEVVIGPGSPLVGRTLREAGFRSAYQAAVVAIHRAGQLVEGKLGQEPIRVADTLVVVSDPDFRKRWRNRSDFLLIADVAGAPPATHIKAWIPATILLVVIGLAALEILPILQGALLGAMVLVATRVLTLQEARRSIDVDVIVTIAAAFGLAAAMQTSGLATSLADGLVDMFDVLGPTGVLLGLVLATLIMTELITNNAAALLMLPIALASASRVGLDPRGVAIAVAVAASASFLTPIGYQTNMMVYGPGGYRFGDYARLGWVLTVLVLVVTVTLTPVFWPS